MSDMAVDYQIRPITVAEYHRMAEVGILAPRERVELLDGELIAMAPVGPRHGYVVRALVERFVLRFAGRAIVDSQGPVTLNDRSEPQPDLMLLARFEAAYRHVLPKPADTYLIVEVSDSSLAYDRGRKLRAYARAGIPELWIVDLRHEVVEAYAAPAGDAFETVRVARRGDRLAPLAFPGDAFEFDSILD